MPIACVDVIVVYKNKFLLLKRKNEPVKGEWWFPGGRILKGEHLNAAAKRKVFEETGLRISKIKSLGADETIFKTGPFGWPTHTVNLVYSGQVTRDKIRLDKQSAQFKWFDKIDPSWHPYIKKFLRQAGFK